MKDESHCLPFPHFIQQNHCEDLLLYLVIVVRFPAYRLIKAFCNYYLLSKIIKQ